jgi:hypothetical protein
MAYPAKSVKQAKITGAIMRKAMKRQIPGMGASRGGSSGLSMDHTVAPKSFDGAGVIPPASRAARSGKVLMIFACAASMAALACAFVDERMLEAITVSRFLFSYEGTEEVSSHLESLQTWSHA